VEVRLAADGGDGDGPGGGDGEGGPAFWAVLFGSGDWHQRTEDRPAPPVLPVGATLRFGVPGALRARIVEVSPLSPRLVRLRFARVGANDDAVWAGIYGLGRPVQYAYLEHDLPLFAVQTVYAGRPWAFEMPSAGRPLSWETMLALRRKGVAWASLTHAAGLSSTGDAALDAALPFPERFDIPAATVDAIAATRARGGRVIAVGTTVVRALEGAAEATGDLAAGPGTTALHIGPGFRPRVVDGLLSGTHAPGESHYALMRAFVSADVLARAAAYAEHAGFVSHELGDAMLILPALVHRRARQPWPRKWSARTVSARRTRVVPVALSSSRR
jgi:S-adenosylmethionine:tRNA ribosyltransferase-isomerase